MFDSPPTGGPAAPSIRGEASATALRSLMDAAGVALVVVGADGISAVNPAAGVLLGGDAARWIGQSLESLAPAEPGHLWRQPGWLDSLPFGRIHDFECAVLRADGDRLRVAGHAWAEPKPGLRGRVVHLTFAAAGLQREAEALRRAARVQASLQRMIEAAPLAIAVFEMPARRILQANQMAELFFGLPLAALLGRTPRQWPARARSHEIGALEASLDLAMESPPGVRREIVDPQVDGAPSRVWDTRFVMIAPDVVQDHSADFAQVLMVANEVTDLRVAEQERFDAAIAQRGMLVQEVHHRIKNNLQGVAGLLQQAAQRYPAVAPLLSEAVGQLNAIAQVYGLQVGSSGPVELAGLLRAVSRSVERTFSRTMIEKLSALSWAQARTVERSLSRTIDFSVLGQDPERWRLPEAEAIPVALTVNELLTNALKHGGGHAVRCVLVAAESDVAIEIVNHGRLGESHESSSRGETVSGLGLVRALLPRRSAELTLTQRGDLVVARVVLRPPAVRKGG